MGTNATLGARERRRWLVRVFKRMWATAGVALAIAILGVVPAVHASAACLPDALQASGSIYRICMPPAGKWNGDLFVYAHGYVDPSQPVAIPEDQLDLGGVNLPDLMTRLGYAFATTSYPKNGLAIVEGITDVVDLVDFFDNQIATPNHVYLVGPSEGGAVTALALEQYPMVFSGGLAACGPVGNFQNQINYVGDFRVLFDYFFPGVLPGSAVDIPQEVMNDWDTVYVPAITAAVNADPGAAAQLLRVARAPIDNGDPTTVLATVINVLWYSAFATNDAKTELGGQPFDNSRRWYRGSDHDLLLNLSVPRFIADPVATGAIAAEYETSGDLMDPVVTLHTTGDPVIRYWHEPLYTRKIAAHGDSGLHVNLPIVAYGHCAFTAGQALTAFAILVQRVTGQAANAFTAALPQPATSGTVP
jgi:hypothetical protein